MSLLLFILLPLLAIFLMPFYRAYLHYVSTVLSMALFGLALTCKAALPLVERVAVDLPLAITFELSSVSWLLVTLFTLSMSLFSLYHLRFSSNKALFVGTNMLLVGVIGLVLSRDIFNIYIFFEISSISAYLLTSLNQDAKAYGGAIRYMIIGAFASLFFLLSIMLIYLTIGVLDLQMIAQRFNLIDEQVQYLILLSLFIALGIKTELFGLNFWVPDVYQASRSAVSGLFSAMLSKSYLFLLFHLAYLLHVSTSQMAFLTLVAALTFAVAEFSALKSRETKRIFAFSTLGQIGLIALALSYGDTALTEAALFLIIVHALAKLMLFLALDLLERRLGSTKSEIFARFESLFLMAVFTVGALSLLGIPPFAGFAAKLSLLKGLAGLEAYGAMALILTVSLIEAAYLFRLLSGFRQGEQKMVVTLSPLERLIFGVMMFALLLLGLMPQPLLALCQEAAQAMLGGYHAAL